MALAAGAGVALVLALSARAEVPGADEPAAVTQTPSGTDPERLAAALDALEALEAALKSSPAAGLALEEGPAERLLMLAEAASLAADLPETRARWQRLESRLEQRGVLRPR